LYGCFQCKINFESIQTNFFGSCFYLISLSISRIVIFWVSQDVYIKSKDWNR
jgi:hypothetical protein